MTIQLLHEMKAKCFLLKKNYETVIGRHIKTLYTFLCVGGVIFQAPKS